MIFKNIFVLKIVISYGLIFQVTSINALDHTITLESGEKVKYAKLLIATGKLLRSSTSF